MTALLVTNDFPPKIGGIQSYLYELWRRLLAPDATVLTTRYPGDAAWDAAQPFRVVRAKERQFFPTPSLARRIDALAREVGADVIFLDPWLPLGQLGPRLRAAPYVVILHGAEVTIPGRLPVSKQQGRRVLRAAAGVVAAGHYSAREAARVAGQPLRGVIVPPGVDVDRFRPVDVGERAATRRAFGLDPHRPLVLGVSRLVPRKGFDRLIGAAVELGPRAQVAIAGDGRHRRAYEARIAKLGVGHRVHLLGRVADAALPSLYASADVFAMPCRERWGGLEAEGFGIVFLEAAAAGVPSVAGRSGGSQEAVLDGLTGFVVDDSPQEVRRAIDRLFDDDALRARMGAAARARAVAEFCYDHLVARIAPIAAGDLSRLGPLE